MRRHKYSSFILTAMLLLIACTGIVFAADTTAPEIIFEPIVEAPSDTPLKLEVEVKDDSKIQRVTLFLRTLGTNEYFKFTARAKADSSYTVVVPSNFMAVGTLEYYFEAVDVNGNIATYPEANAAGDPLQLAVSVDDSVPTANLASPKGLVGKDSFAVVVLLDDKAANIDPETAEIYFNDKDITEKARVSTRSIAFQIASRDILTTNHVLIRVKDRAGNQLEKTFRISQKPIISGSYNMDASFDQSGSTIGSTLDLDAKWGAFSASASIETEDFSSNDFESKFNLLYDSRFVDLDLIDVSTDISDLTVSGYNYRGGEIQLDLGPLYSLTAFGYSQKAVAGEQYRRRFLGMRSGLDFGWINGGWNFAEIIDELDSLAETDRPTSNPFQNYVLSLDGGLSVFGMTLDSELAASLYFEKANANIWDTDTFDTTSIPQAAQWLFPIPVSKENLLEQIDPGNKKIYVKPDFGGKIELSTPLYMSELSGSVYYYGPLYKTIAGNGDQDSTGYNVSFDTDRIADIVDLSVSYDKYRDNLDYLLLSLIPDEMKDNKVSEELPLTYGDIVDLISEFIGDGDAKEYTDYEVEVGFYPENFDTSLKFSHQKETDFATGVLDTDEDAYTVKVKNIKFKIDQWDASLRGSYSNAKENEYDAAGTNIVGWKKTNKNKVSMNIEKGEWGHRFGYSVKNEVDHDDTKVQSPTISMVNSWSRKDVTFGQFNFYRVKVDSDIAYTTTSGDNIDEQKLDYELELGLSPNQNSQWIVAYNYVQETDNKDSSNNSTESIGKIKYSIDF